MKPSPSLGSLVGSIFENFKEYNVKSRIDKFEVEDLYLKREQAPPIDLVEEIEKLMEKL